MKEKKNIDRLYQEKFKDFTIEPSEHIWAGIAARQNQKKKRILPLWFQLSGAAAILVLLLLAGTFWFNTENDLKTPQLVNQEQENTSDSLKKEDKTIYAPTPSETINTNQEAITSTTTKSSEVLNTENISVENNIRETIKNTSTQHRSAVVTNGQNSLNNASVGKNGIGQPIEKATVTSNILNEDLKPNEPLHNTAASPLKKPVVETAVVQNDIENTTQDKQTPTEIDPNTLEKLANKTKEEAIATTDDPNKAEMMRWGITPMVAPVYYDSFSGSGIDQQFANNTKRADVNLSYGVQVSYAVSKRITVRSGINKVELGYSTEQIGFTPSISARNPNTMISSIDFNDNSQIIQLDNNNNSGLPNLPSGNQTEFATSISANKNTSLRQELGYIEIPVEAEYTLLDSKIGLQVIGGLSSMFLNTNSISLEEEGNLVSELGKSNSLNNTSFSTNIGLGIDYKFTERIQFKLEPMFKYQLNAYTKSVSDFKPYYLGLYTGLSFKF
ncbi:outer membrane beta-barrel protein [Leeuwenhoekiella sp. MAR_2009_132]|uniref:outer membrane beta-barrel protein n=1 Tax=Leeuwenhoekiella sp. MAR_2009_132 TaxID=1392489 RepID=UPI00048E018C|nr:outer membrane beta-barrel protein [Leeuwenhoekiella sp. MAR_2009_132]